MASIRRVPLFLPSAVQCRHKGKFQTKKPRPVHIDRRVFLAATEPILPTQIENPARVCSRINRVAAEQQKGEEGVDLYQRFLVRQCKKVLEENRLLIVFQQLSLTAEDYTNIRNKLFKKDFHLLKFPNSVISSAVEGSKLQNMGPLFKGHNVYVVSSEPNMAQLVQLTHKMPQIVMLGGVVESRMLSRQELLLYSKLGSLDAVRGQLVNSLQSPACNITSLLKRPTQNLAANLGQYITDKSE